MKAAENFLEVACEAGILQDVMNGLILTGMVERNDDNARKAVSMVLQEQFIKNPNVLKAFHDFARETTYEILIDMLFDAAKKKQGVLNNDPDMFIKILFKG